jgi:hypothetical protein
VQQAGCRGAERGCRARAGLANLKTVGIEAATGEKLRLSVTKTQAKNAAKPSKKSSTSTMAASSGRKVCKAVAADVAKYRPDLKARARRLGWARRGRDGRKCAPMTPPIPHAPRSRALPTHRPRACRTPPSAAPPLCRSRCA